MSRSRFQYVVLLLFVVVAAGIPRDAAAQLGRLKKAVANKAVEAAVANQPPTKVKQITLTSAQIAQVNTGLRAELAKAAVAQKEYEQGQKQFEQETKAYEKAKADYDKRNEGYSQCAEKVGNADRAKSDALRERSEKSMEAATGEDEEARLEALAARAAAAAERVANGTATAEDRKTLAEMQGAGAAHASQGAKVGADMQASSEFDQGAQARLEKECGKKPEEPKAPASSPGTPGEVVRNAGAEAAGVSLHQYAVWRDEGTAYAESNTEVEPSEASEGQASGGGVSPEEAKAINEGIQETRVILEEMKQAKVPI